MFALPDATATGAGQLRASIDGRQRAARAAAGSITGCGYAQAGGEFSLTSVAVSAMGLALLSTVKLERLTPPDIVCASWKVLVSKSRQTTNRLATTVRLCSWWKPERPQVLTYLLATPAVMSTLTVLVAPAAMLSRLTPPALIYLGRRVMDNPALAPTCGLAVATPLLQVLEFRSELVLTTLYELVAVTSTAIVEVVTAPSVPPEPITALLPATRSHFHQLTL